MLLMIGAAILICALVLSSGRVLSAFDSLVYLAVGIAAFLMGAAALHWHLKVGDPLPALPVLTIVAVDLWLSQRHHGEAIRVAQDRRRVPA